MVSLILLNEQENNGNNISKEVTNPDTNDYIVKNSSEQNLRRENINNASDINKNINTDFNNQQQESSSEENRREADEPKIISQIDLTQDANENIPLSEDFEVPRPITFKREDPLTGIMLFELRVR